MDSPVTIAGMDLIGVDTIPMRIRSRYVHQQRPSPRNLSRSPAIFDCSMILPHPKKKFWPPMCSNKDREVHGNTGSTVTDLEEIRMTVWATQRQGHQVNSRRLPKHAASLSRVILCGFANHPGHRRGHHVPWRINAEHWIFRYCSSCSSQVVITNRRSGHDQSWTVRNDSYVDLHPTTVGVNRRHGLWFMYDLAVFHGVSQSWRVPNDDDVGMKTSICG